MPELPEVETIRLELNKLIKNKQIKSVKVRLAKQVYGNKNIFIQKVQGSKVIGLKRRAKTLIINLNNNYSIIIHLKMTGQLIYVKKSKLAGGGHPISHNLKDLPNKYSHIIFNFADGSRLFFNDTRQFGWAKLVKADELEKMNAQFGPEPLAKDFTSDKFKKLFEHKKTAIKPLLMDQKFIAGVGNIYAQEACYCANIKPTRPAHKISESELKKLYTCLRRILQMAISKKGTSANDYVDAFGRQGSMNNYLKVYGKSGQKCSKCRSVIKCIRQAQRTTCYCAKCQT